MNRARRCHPHAASARARLPGIAAFALVALLLGAQTLGLWHRTEHPPASHVVTAAHADGHASLHTGVFGHGADESATCRLFDQLTHGDSLRAVVVELPVFEPVAAFVAPRIERLAQSAPAPYQARGPPAFG